MDEEGARMMLELVDRLDEVTSNCATMSSYLHSEDPYESSFAQARIAKGACFLAINVGGELSFFPSRFLGYKNNSIEMHLGGSETLDGKLTNPQISRLLGTKLDKDEDIDQQYLLFCSKHRIRASLKNRRYWSLSRYDMNVGHSIRAFEEGLQIIKEIKTFQRSSALVANIKANRKPICECCAFDFEKAYGQFAKGYIECHHLDPLSKRAGKNVPTTEDEIALLCANCHRMVHRTREGLTLAELRAEMKKASR